MTTNQYALQIDIQLFMVTVTFTIVHLDRKDSINIQIHAYCNCFKMLSCITAEINDYFVS